MKLAATNAKQIRQGDVLLTRIPAPAANQITPVIDPQSNNPVQGLWVPGERTGHAHRLPSQVYDTPAGRVLYLDRPQVLSHEEHEHITIPAGWWIPTLQREYVPRQRPRNRSNVD